MPKGRRSKPFSGSVKALLLAFACVVAAVLLGDPRPARAQFNIPIPFIGGPNIYVGPGQGYRQRGYSRRGYSRRGSGNRRQARGNRDGGTAVGSSSASKVTAGSGRVKASTTD
jgi:hypothetical protein